jgi:hypothetical protein
MCPPRRAAARGELTCDQPHADDNSQLYAERTVCPELRPFEPFPPPPMVPGLWGRDVRAHLLSQAQARTDHQGWAREARRSLVEAAVARELAGFRWEAATLA